MDKILKNINFYRKVFDVYYDVSDKYWRINLEDAKEALRLLMISDKSIYEAEEYVKKIKINEEKSNEATYKDGLKFISTANEPDSNYILLDFEEFVSLILRFDDSSIDLKLNEAFYTLDEKKEGKISKDDLMEIPSKIDNSEIIVNSDDIYIVLSDWKLIDQNGDIKYDQYIDYLQKFLNE